MKHLAGFFSSFSAIMRTGPAKQEDNLRFNHKSSEIENLIIGED